MDLETDRYIRSADKEATPEEKLPTGWKGKAKGIISWVF
jgi:hypothetical protein